ncbi:SGNH_hydro domain-containing protein, partial [Durusdinium trenchii]
MAHNYTGRYAVPWPRLLKERLALYGLEVVESALCSRTTIHADAGNKSWMTGARPHYFDGLDHLTPEFLSCSPKWLVVLLGTNDLRVAIRKAAKARTRLDARLVAQNCAKIGLKARELHESNPFQSGKLNIVLVVPPLVNLNELAKQLGYDESSAHIAQDFERAYTEECALHDFLCAKPSIDMSASVDGIHITESANISLAEAVWGVIRPVLGPPPEDSALDGDAASEGGSADGDSDDDDDDDDDDGLDDDDPPKGARRRNKRSRVSVDDQVEDDAADDDDEDEEEEEEVEEDLSQARSAKAARTDQGPSLARRSSLTSSITDSNSNSGSKRPQVRAMARKNAEKRMTRLFNLVCKASNRAQFRLFITTVLAMQDQEPDRVNQLLAAAEEILQDINSKRIIRDFIAIVKDPTEFQPARFCKCPAAERARGRERGKRARMATPVTLTPLAGQAAVARGFGLLEQ